MWRGGSSRPEEARNSNYNRSYRLDGVVNGLVKAYKFLLDHVDLREQLAKRAYERALSYSWEKSAHQTFSVLASVLEKNSQNPL